MPPRPSNGGCAKSLRPIETVSCRSIGRSVAEEWGRLSVPDPLPVVDGLLAATAAVHGLVLATRNVKDLIRTGVALFNPFEPIPARPQT